VECRRENVTKEGNSRSVQSATVGVCDLFVLRVVCGRKAPKSICKEGSPGFPRLRSGQALRLRATSAVSRDPSVRRSAQDDDFVGV
jgi:hypothetical protein